MPPAYVKPYVKRGKTDAGDAEAICEAVTRPTMRFVPVKSVEQQAALSLHRTRDLLVRQRTQLVNMIRGLLAEFGIEIPKRTHHALACVRRTSPAKQLRSRAAREGDRSLAEQAVPCRTAPPARAGADGMASLQRAGATHRDRAGGGSARRDRAGRDGDRSHAVSVRSAVRRVARADAAAKLQRRQGATGADLQDGRPVPAQAADRRHDLARARARTAPASVDPRIAALLARKPGACRHGRHGQPRGPGRLGDHGAGRQSIARRADAAAA